MAEKIFIWGKQCLTLASFKRTQIKNTFMDDSIKTCNPYTEYILNNANEKDEEAIHSITLNHSNMVYVRLYP